MEHVFSGGGRGAFLCRTTEAESALRSQLINKAHDIGADIAIGVHPSFAEASQNAGALYPALPDAAELEGPPCDESGLFPVRRGTHRWVTRRIYDRGEVTFRRYERAFLDGDPGGLREPRRGIEVPDLAGRELQFFRDVSAGEGADGDGRAGAAALGNRNRWAVIVMDGNDMGSQFSTQNREVPSDRERHAWVSAASRALDGAVRLGCRDAIGAVTQAWVRDEQASVPSSGVVTLPVRPLIVGGDDVIVLCHARYAMRFAREVCKTFEHEAAKSDAAWSREHGTHLWPATGGRLTISAGLLFAPVSVPLVHTISAAEELLKSAKGRGRKELLPGSPSPACVDWASLTSSMLEHPAVERQRDLRFHDEDLGMIVSLTKKPYTLARLEELERLAGTYGGVPLSIRARIPGWMRAAEADRFVALERLRKNHPVLAKDLDSKEGRWRDESGDRCTDVLDALELLTEDRRMDRETAGGRA